MNKFIIGLLSEIISYTNSNIHMIDFGKNNFIIKMCSRLILRKLELVIKTQNFENFDWKQILKDLGSITK